MFFVFFSMCNSTVRSSEKFRVDGLSLSKHFREKNAQGRNSKLLFNREKKNNSDNQPMPNNKLFPNVCCWSQWWVKPIRKNKKVIYFFVNLLGGWQLVVDPRSLKNSNCLREGVWRVHMAHRSQPGSVCLKTDSMGTMGWASPFCTSIWWKYFFKELFFQPPDLRKSITLNERKLLILETSHFPLAWLWEKG